MVYRISEKLRFEESLVRLNYLFLPELLRIAKAPTVNTTPNTVSGSGIER
ncbi:MAG: hypothetical protein WBA93_29025 [Microcoleaceae cyanobacterium]